MQLIRFEHLYTDPELGVTYDNEVLLSSISIADPRDDLNEMLYPNDIVIPKQHIKIHIKDPLLYSMNLNISAATSAGFTRAEIVNKICDLYHQIYAEKPKGNKYRVLDTDMKRLFLENIYKISNDLFGLKITIDTTDD
jgi:hypothetical protein